MALSLTRPIAFSALAIGASFSLRIVKERFGEASKLLWWSQLAIMHLGGVPWFKATLKAYNAPKLLKLDMQALKQGKWPLSSELNLRGNKDHRKALGAALLAGGVAFWVMANICKKVAGIESQGPLARLFANISA